MKKLNITITCIFLVLVFSACSALKTKKSKEKQHPENIEYFLSEFEKSVLKHDAERLLELMDQDYVRDQHDNFLNGNTTQFVNEFFCGNIVKGQGFKCLKFKEISSLKRTGLEESHEGFRVSYIVSGKTDKVQTEWLITVKSFNGKTYYGLYGASG